MSEYLDKTGLSYFWGKVKEKLNNKADESDVINVKYQLEQQLNYKANRNQLNGKADIDRYQVRTISTNKFKFSSTISLGSSYSNALYLDNPNQNNFAEAFPSGYTIWCILAVNVRFFDNETDYNNNTESVVPDSSYSIMPIESSSNGKKQSWSVVFSQGYNSVTVYGAKIYYTLLVVKPQLPVG